MSATRGPVGRGDPGSAKSAEATHVFEAAMLGAGTRADALPPPTTAGVALAGRSNVGKSSLLNTLLARRNLARTSRTPGCTRTVNVYRARLEGDATVELVDLPGYGFAARSKAERKEWGRIIEDVLRSRAGLRAMLVLVDARRGVEGDDADCVRLAQDLGLLPIVVATKIDKLPTSQRKLAVTALGRAAGVRTYGFSSETGEGRDALWRALLGAAAVGAVKGAPATPRSGEAGD